MPKTYNNIDSSCIEIENIRKSIVFGLSHKKETKEIVYVINNLDKVVNDTHDMMLNHTTPDETYKMIEIIEGYKHKRRQIAKPNFMYNQIIQYVLLSFIKPMVFESIYEHAHGSLKNRGPMQSKNVIERWLRKDPKGTRYCLQMDLHHCYPSVDQDRLINLYNEKIRDKDFMIELEKSIRSCPNGIAPGAPLSVYHLHFLLTPFDHWMTEQKCVKHYLRHADDLIIFGSNKKELHKLESYIISYMKNVYEMDVNYNHQVFPIEWTDKSGKKHGKPLDTCEFLFYRDKVILREKHLLKIVRKVNKVAKKNHISFYDSQQILCQLGWIKHSDTYNVFSDKIINEISIRKLKKIVSYHQKMINAKKKEEIKNDRMET